MTLLARDEADVVDAQIAFHLHAGVDHVIATDNASSDRTTEILERYERADICACCASRATTCDRRAWVTRMARLAATEHEADWVINSDADEFWWPRGGLVEGRPRSRAAAVRRRPRLLAPLPAPSRRRRVLRGADDRPARTPRLILARRRRSTTPTRRSPTGRTRRSRSRRGTTTPRPRGFCRCVPGIPLEVLHFSFRSIAQLERKAARRLAPQPAATSRPCTRSSSTRPTGRAASRRSTMRSRSTSARSSRAWQTARLPSTRACATLFARSATTTGRSCSPTEHGGWCSSARARSTTRRTPQSRRRSSRSTASCAPSSACARWTNDSRAVERGALGAVRRLARR